MTWRDGLFAHWPVEPASLDPHVPDPFQLDTRDGQAWLSVLPFVLDRAGFRYTPRLSRLTFPELNLRTYVRYDGAPGLYFIVIDVDHEIVPRLVSTTTRLPVHRADVRHRKQGHETTFSSARRRSDARFAVSYRPTGQPYRAETDSLDHWLLERRRLYAPSGPGILYAEIAHEPWRLRPAEVTIDENTLFDVRGLPDPAAEPRVRYTGRLPMTGSITRRLHR